MGRGRQRVMGRGRVGMGVRDREVLGAAGGHWWVLVLPTWVLVLPKPGKTPPKKKKNKASAAASLSQPPPNQPPLPSPALSCPARGSFTIFDSFLEQKSRQKTKGGPPLPETHSPCLSPDRFPARAQPIPPRLCDAFHAKSLFFHFSR